MRSIEVTQIDLNGKIYDVVLTHAVLRRAELALNKYRSRPDGKWLAIDGIIGSAVQSFQSGEGFPHDLTEIILWEAIKEQASKDELTFDTLGNVIVDRQYVLGRIAEAINKSYPAPASQEDGAEKKSP